MMESIQKEAAEEVISEITQSLQNNEAAQVENDSGTRKNRIKYDKEFLLECFSNPCCLVKPNGVIHKDCALEVIRIVKDPFALTNAYFGTKRRHDRRRNKTSDNSCKASASGAILVSLMQKSGNAQDNLGKRVRFDVPHVFRDYNTARKSNDEGSYISGEKLFRNEDGRRHVFESDVGEKIFNNEEQPTWFTDGPNSKYETVELHGFLDDHRNEASTSNGLSKEPDVQHDAAYDDDGDIDKILKMNYSSGLLNDSMDSTSSASFKNHLPPNAQAVGSAIGRQNNLPRYNDFEGRVNQATDELGDSTVHKMGKILRDALLKSENQPGLSDKIADTSGKLAYMSAFKKLLQKTVNHGTSKFDGQKFINNASLQNDSIQRHSFYNPSQMVNALQGFKTQAQRKANCYITPQEILQPYPLEIQYLVLNFQISPEFIAHPEVQKLTFGIRCGKISLDEILVYMSICSAPIRNILAGVLKLCFTELVPVPRPLSYNSHYKLIVPTPMRSQIARLSSMWNPSSHASYGQNGQYGNFRRYGHYGQYGNLGRYGNKGPNGQHAPHATHTFDCLAMSKHLDDIVLNSESGKPANGFGNET